jgi:uncharacterized membrane protein YbaN (DUF454 family)
MDDGRKDHLQMIQGVIDRMGQNSFQLKGWAVTLAAALEVFLKGEAKPVWLFVPALPVVAFWLLDAWYLRRERLFRRLFDHVRTETGAPDFSMDARPFAAETGSVFAVALSPTIICFYGPILLAVILLALFLPR